LYLRHRYKKEISKKYGYKEVDRFLLSTPNDNDDIDLTHLSEINSLLIPSRPNSIYGSKNIQSVECPFKIDVIGIVEAAVGDVKQFDSITHRQLCYVVRVSTGMHSWEVHRTSNDFKELDRTLINSHPNLSFPTLPEVCLICNLNLILG
jgi:hypothetical protein